MTRGSEGGRGEERCVGGRMHGGDGGGSGGSGSVTSVTLVGFCGLVRMTPLVSRFSSFVLS